MVPKSRIYQMLRKGEVRVNSGRIKPTYRLATGDRIRIPPVRESVAGASVAVGTPLLAAQRGANKPAGYQEP